MNNSDGQMLSVLNSIFNSVLLSVLNSVLDSVLASVLDSVLVKKKKSSILRLYFQSISPPTCELFGRSPAGPTGMWERLSLEGISPSAIVVQQLSITQYSVVHHSELVSEKPPSWEGKSNK